MVDQDENESGNPGHTHPGASALLWGGVFIDREQQKKEEELDAPEQQPPDKP
ncbi:hypothetical protein Pint_29390 [Pistacia integerrima]|uniref:Uncharacterized protein n=1 Tax=Pistacia integerrima TaxID=434235 RepID=A0ACC0X068_9ROSI|nr:hypothetical protein Pint_29390 [Pistacia integerrima]